MSKTATEAHSDPRDSAGPVNDRLQARSGKKRDTPEPPEQDWNALEKRGWQRLAEVRNLELLRGLFRRPLEIWLLLDRALLLSENGYAIRLGTFCPAELTPRNLMLIAEFEHPSAST